MAWIQADKKAMKRKIEGLVLHLSVLYQSWIVDAEGLEFVLHSEMRPVHPHFPKIKNLKKHTLLVQ